ncbi:copine-8-like isoform X2 [Zootermopsis nevadensis]|uniref:copine-8-like isoform X2 n=1 Tax=Zootermopsis nevadensis TaxID=136037 RepID=UPI000B8E4F58|nr:copine-8-like isoform X2 [Zootermopsis nevadensis]
MGLMKLEDGCCRQHRVVGLVGKDVLSKSDPICVTYVQRFGDPRWVEFHRTEVISNTHDPDFVAKVRLFYRFEEQQPLKFEIYDSDSSSSSLDRHDFLGAATCSLGQIISNGKVQLPLSLTGTGTTEGRGHMIIIAEELAALKDEVIMQFSGTKLDKKDFFGKSDPFLVFHKSTESGDYIVVYKTEVVKHTLNPVWPKFSVPVRSLCNGDYDRNIKVVCYDHESDGDHNLIGEFYVTLRQLTQGPSPSNVFQCINPEKKKKKSSYIHSGLITLNSIEVRQIYSFMDYMKGGTQLHCSIAIDFTGSNGNPAMPESLHYISNIPNAYEQAIQSVGRIIQDYDTDKLFPVLGFGARIPPDGQVSHEFFVNMNPSNPYCNGVSGVLEAYRRCILQVQLYGPTNFSPVINHVARFASTYRDGSSYFILLILTDGVITDMPQTIAAIVSASLLPMSIIIVGIGNADFGAMEVLDADTTGLSSGGVHAARDIVQFVPFRKFATASDPHMAKIRLAKEVLAEIPRQFTDYMKANNIAPKPPQLNVLVVPPDPELIPVA